MRRSPRVLLAWAAAAIVTLATVRVVATDLGALHRRARALGPDVGVVLAARDLPLGTTLTAADVRVVRRPAATVAPDTLHDPAATVGRVVGVALARDDAVRLRHLARSGAAGADGAVPAGRRAVHVVVADGFRPPPGSVVDVLATFDPALGDSAGGETFDGPSPGAGGATVGGRATVVAQGAQVLADTVPGAAGSAGSSGATADVPGTGPGVTLLVTETEARAVAYAAALGEVALALAPVESACCAIAVPSG
jgi:Flp pilus assembly protein CpaB